MTFQKELSRLFLFNSNIVNLFQQFFFSIYDCSQMPVCSGNTVSLLTLIVKALKKIILKFSKFMHN